MATIIETVKNGKMKRICSECKKDVTEITSWIGYKFCPWCGSKNEGIKKIN